jgi:hypothetical protein
MTDREIEAALVLTKGDVPKAIEMIASAGRSEVAAAGWLHDLFKSREQKETERAKRVAADEEFREKERRSSLGPRGRLIEDAKRIMASEEYPRIERASERLRTTNFPGDENLYQEYKQVYDAIVDFLGGTGWTRRRVPEGFQEDDWGALTLLSEYKYKEALAIWAARDILVRRGQPLVKSANSLG